MIKRMPARFPKIMKSKIRAKKGKSVKMLAVATGDAVFKRFKHEDKIKWKTGAQQNKPPWLFQILSLHFSTDDQEYSQDNGRYLEPHERERDWINSVWDHSPNRKGARDQQCKANHWGVRYHRIFGVQHFVFPLHWKMPYNASQAKRVNFTNW